MIVFLGPLGALVYIAMEVVPDPQKGRTRGSPKLQLAVFEHGHIDGVPDAVERWQRARQEHIDDVAYRVRALQMMPRGSEENAQQYLAARVAERPAPASSRSAGIRGRVLDIWQPFSRPERGALFARAERVREEAEGHLATLRRTLSLPQTLEAAAPVFVSSDRIVRDEYVASIVNRRDVPIEAVGFEIVPAGEERPSSGQSSDFCLADVEVGPGSSGRIAAGNTREFPVSTAITDASQLPTLRLTFVLFDDLSFEGSVAERDRLFQRREHQADDLAFAHRIRTELAALPADAVHAFLVEKRTERTKQLLAQGRRPDVRSLDEMIEQARRSPEGLRQTDSATIERVEAQRQRLLRHAR